MFNIPTQKEENAELRILIVDDNPDITKSTALLLEGEGHTTCIASNGLQAIEVASAFKPDLVLLDIEMPYLDGYGVIQWIRDHLSKQKILIAAITGTATESGRRRALLAGVNEYFSKPIRLEQLKQLIETARCYLNTPVMGG